VWLSPVQPAPTVTEPFPGPRPFSRGESDIFKGRERESRDVRDLVLSYQVVVFHSHSGSGKTSLVNAGLLPLLADEGIDAYPTARVGGQVPAGLNASQIRNIYSFDAMSSCLGSSFDPKMALQMGLDEVFLAKPDSAPRLLILDQFEELFTSHPERWQDRKPFVEQLCNLCKANKDLRVLVVIRDDHLAELDAYAEMLPYSLRIRYRLERLTEDSALKGIVEPLTMAGYSCEPGVAEDLVANLRKVRVKTATGVEEIVGEFVEPVHLQVVCQNLWKNRSREKRPFTADDVKKFADVNQALRSFYDQAIAVTIRKAGLKETKLRGWFDTELITSDGTRGLVHRGRDRTEGVPNSAVDTLEQEHVIRAEPRAGGLWYEITHDRFIPPIRESNRAWVAKRRRRLALFASLFLFALLMSASLFVYRHQQQTQRRVLETQTRFLQAQSEIRLARDAEEANQLDEAVKHYKAALDLYTLLDDRASQGDTEFKLGLSYINLLKMPEAEQHFQNAYKLHKVARNWKAAADDEAATGDVHTKVGAMDKALAAYEESLSLYRQNANVDRFGEGSALSGIGWTYWQLGDYAHALPFLLDSSKTFDSLDRQLRDKSRGQGPGEEDRSRRARDTIRQKAYAITGIGAIYASQGRIEECIANFKSALNEFQTLGEPHAIAEATSNLAYGYFLEGNYAKALSILKEAEAIHQRRGLSDPELEDLMMADESVVYIEQGKYSLGLETANKALTISRSQPDMRWTGVCLWAESLAYLHLRELDKSEDAAQQALNIFRRVGDKEMESRDLDTLGLLAEARRKHEEAILCYRRAVEINTEIGNNTLFAKRAREDLERLTRGSRSAH
jgi:tetratricopeptide (TPR) repeat protein